MKLKVFIGLGNALCLGIAGAAGLFTAEASAQSLTYTPYAVTTVAGIALNPGSSNGTGTSAQFNSPYGVAADASGNVYVADSGNNSLRKITPGGVVTTIAGVSGNFKGIAIDGAGANLYLTDFTAGTITKVVVSSGSVSTLNLTGGTLNNPIGICVDSGGNIYVADSGNFVIRKISPGGAMTTLAGTVGNSGGVDGTGGAAQFAYPTGIAVNRSSGNVYVADSSGNFIRMVTQAGVVTTLCGVFGQPGAVDGSLGTALFRGPFGIAVDPSGNLYVTDNGSDLLREISSSGSVTTLAGQLSFKGYSDGTGSGARFSDGRGICVNASGILWIADADASTIRKATVGSLPAITTQPASQSVNAGTSPSLSVVAAGVTGYQWQFNGTSISGATNLTLTLAGIGTSQQGSYTVVVSNGYGSVTSNAAILTVNTAPSISTQPQSQAVNAGLNVTFTVVATGSPAPAYQWYLNSVALANGTQANGSVVSGATSATLTVANTQSGNAGSYAVVVSSTAGSITSTAATLTVNTVPVITTQPQSQTVNAGTNATFTVAAPGTPVPTYQWYLNSQAISGATNASYTIAGAQTSNAGSYTVIASNTAGSVTSAVATLTVNTVPVIITQPQSQTVNAGANVTIGVVAVGTPAPAFQWYLNGQAISGATSTFYAIIGVQTSNGGSYTVVVGNAAGSVTSSVATLAVNPASGSPAITTQPVSQTVNAGAGATLSVTASGATGYQWQFNGTNILGATNSTLTVANIGTTQRGSYTVIVSNSNGSVTSSAANVAVAVNSSLYNISSRAYIGTGQFQNLVAGFYTNGSGSKNVVVRGIGPNLAIVAPTLAGLTLPNPKLTLYNGSAAVLATNTAWGGDAILTKAFTSVYATPLLSGSSDTAAFVGVPAGPGIGYTTQIDGLNNGSGVALVEVYDYDSYVGTPAARLINISSRAVVGTGNQSLVAGFYVVGSGSQTLLIRAVGPALASTSAYAGLTLAKPTLSLYDASGNVVATNVGWGNAVTAGNSTTAAGIQQATTAIMNGVYASVIAPGSNDCAMVVTLPTGGNAAGYTAQVSSFDSTTGLALVEVYNVP